MFLFLIPLMLGFVLAGASAFTAAYSRRWGERGGRIVTSILRNLLGIPLWLFGFVLAWTQPAAPIFSPSGIALAVGWFLVTVGSVPALWGHVQLGWRTHMPSVRDTLVREGLYAYVRHPIYSGGFLIFVGLALLKPTFTVVLASVLAVSFLVVQAILEEIDLLQRLPPYKAYMQEVPRFVPQLRGSGKPFAVVIFYTFLILLLSSSTSLWREPGGNRFVYLVPLLLGFALVGASVFTAAYSRWWGERRGERATSILRNYLGIPLAVFGFVLAWRQPTPLVFDGGAAARSLGWLFLIVGSVPFIWGHVVLGLTHRVAFGPRPISAREFVRLCASSDFRRRAFDVCWSGFAQADVSCCRGLRAWIHLAYCTSAIGGDRSGAAYA
jgi:protein-S-isoprenylcysteine O-methyltransferase Ste14